MAKIVNRSDTPVEVYGIDHADSDNKKRWTLPAGKQSVDTFECLQVRVTDGGGGEIFESNDWWQIFTEYAFVYEMASGLFNSSLSLHCIPFEGKVTAHPTTPPWDQGYLPTLDHDPDRDQGTTVDPGPMIRSSPEFPIHATDLGVVEGELPAIEDADHGFGRQVRTRMKDATQDETYITIRILGIPDPALTPDELSLLAGPGTTQYDQWKTKIETVWNPKLAENNFHCEMIWTNLLNHNSIRILSAKGFYLRQLIAKSTMYWWAIDLDDRKNADGSVDKDFWPTSAHEYGHHLGFDDGYIYEPELPFLAAESNVVGALQKQKQKRIRLRYNFSVDLFKRRVARRMAGNGTPTDAPNIMEQIRHSVAGKAVWTIDDELIQALLDRKTQPLHFDVRMFDVHPEWLM